MQNTRGGPPVQLNQININVRNGVVERLEGLGAGGRHNLLGYRSASVEIIPRRFGKFIMYLAATFLFSLMAFNETLGFVVNSFSDIPAIWALPAFSALMALVAWNNARQIFRLTIVLPNSRVFVYEDHNREAFARVARHFMEAV